MKIYISNVHIVLSKFNKKEIVLKDEDFDKIYSLIEDMLEGEYNLRTLISSIIHLSKIYPNDSKNFAIRTLKILVRTGINIKEYDYPCNWDKNTMEYEIYLQDVERLRKIAFPPMKIYQKRREFGGVTEVVTDKLGYNYQENDYSGFEYEAEYPAKRIKVEGFEIFPRKFNFKLFEFILPDHRTQTVSKNIIYKENNLYIYGKFYLKDDGNFKKNHLYWIQNNGPAVDLCFVEDRDDIQRILCQWGYEESGMVYLKKYKKQSLYKQLQLLLVVAIFRDRPTEEDREKQLERLLDMFGIETLLKKLGFFGNLKYYKSLIDDDLSLIKYLEDQKVIWRIELDELYEMEDDLFEPIYESNTDYEDEGILISNDDDEDDQEVEIPDIE
ncbi:MAG: hypothetical protein EOM85_03625 [Candidatus Moranbacteria bacterium]|nr:hypothetical protein [Candidatus Moranbacteria bacterium]